MFSDNQAEHCTEIRALRSHYRTGQDDLGRDFFSPCLKSCVIYWRAAGFFSSSVLLTWSAILTRLTQSNSIRIQLLISPILSADDVEALKKAIDEQERDRLRQELADQIIRELLRTESPLENLQFRLKLLSWMIANDKLIIRFGFPDHIDEPGLFHEKIGVFSFPWGDRVAFTGSANESVSGHHRNYESLDVYRDWLQEDKERVETKSRQFVEAWENNASGLKVLSLSPQVLREVRQFSPVERPVQANPNEEQETPTDARWRHQEEAVAAFIKVRSGVLEMATGTGKTKTAEKILSLLLQKDAISGAIVSTSGTDLLEQWSRELGRWTLIERLSLRIFRHYGNYHELGEFALDPAKAVLVISREQLHLLFKRLPTSARSNMIIIHDEVHGLGSPVIRQQLTGEHKHFGYRLGLSATPDREYDQQGNEFITEEIGAVFFRFGLEDAIAKGILCEFDYVPLSYELTEDDKQRIQSVYALKEARKKAGQPMPDEEIAIQISRIFKTAERKPQVFLEYLSKSPEILLSTIIFVEEREYGNRILEMIHDFTHLYRTYYSEDDSQNLIDFAKGKIDCLITCHRIAQGIDIRGLRNVVLFSSARAKLETIQRIGRCLRIDPNFPQKRATVVDFILTAEPENNDDSSADNERLQWLTNLSAIKRKE